MAAMSEIEVLADGYGLLEGPRVDGEDNLYFSDVPNGGVYRRRPDGTIEDVAVTAYREAYGGEIARKRFLAQYRDKKGGDDLRPYHGVMNVAGATLSVEAAGRAVHKAQAVAAVLDAESTP